MPQQKRTTTRGSVTRPRTTATKVTPRKTDKPSAAYISSASEEVNIISSEGVSRFLQTLGVDENLMKQTVDSWRSQLSTTVTRKIEDTDLDDALDKAREFTTGSVEKLKATSQKNPKLFYSGLAALLVGSAMLATAARQQDSEGDEY